MPEYDWLPFLTQWSRELLASPLYTAPPSYYNRTPTPEARATGWLGAPGASAAQLAALEARLGVSLPPSYRAFLQVTNGWGKTTPFIDRLWSTEEVDWFAVRHQDWIDAWVETDQEYGALPVLDADYLVYGEAQNPSALRVEYLQSALEISDRGDSAIYLLNPQIVTPDGEWEAWFFANWQAGACRYPSFWELMQAEYQSFRRLEQPDADVAE